MSKWILDQWEESLDYPTLGFTADPDDILDATAAPDGRWSLNGDQGAAETVTRYTIGGDPSYVEPGDRHILAWYDEDNSYEPTSAATLLASEEWATALSATYAGWDKYIGVPLAADGHSFVAATASTSPGARIHERIKAWFGLGTVTNSAVAGTRAEQMACRALSGAAQNTRRLGFVSSITNNASRGDLAAPLRAFQWAWDAYCSLQCAAARASAASVLFTYGATGWTSGASANSTNGTRWTGTVGSDFWFAYTETGTGVDVVLIATPTGTGVATFYDEDDEVLGTIDLSATTDDLETPAVCKLRNVGATGRRVIRGHVTSGTIIVDSYRVPSPKPPRFFVLGEGGRDLTRSPNTPPGTRTYNETLAYLKTLLIPILEDYPSFVFVDLLPGFDPTTMTDDGLHPNDLGANDAMLKLVPVMQAAEQLPGTNVIFNDFPLTITVPTGPDAPSGGTDGLGNAAGSIASLSALGAGVGSQAILSWPAAAAITGVTDHDVEYRTTTGPGAWTPFAHSASATPGITVTGLTNGVSYDFRVRAKVGATTYPWSPIATTIPLIASVADSYGRADSAANVLGSTEVGALAYTVTASASTADVRIVSNALKAVALGARSTVTLDDSDSSTGERLTVNVTDWGGASGLANSLGIIIRWQDVNNYLYAVRDSSGFFSLFKYSGGSLSAVGTAGTVAVPTTACTLAIEDSGSNVIKGYVNGALSFTSGTVTDYSAATKFGLHLSATAVGAIVDNLVYG